MRRAHHAALSAHHATVDGDCGLDFLLVDEVVRGLAVDHDCVVFIGLVVQMGPFGALVLHRLAQFARVEVGGGLPSLFPSEQHRLRLDPVMVVLFIAAADIIGVVNLAHRHHFLGTIDADISHKGAKLWLVQMLLGFAVRLGAALRRQNVIEIVGLVRSSFHFSRSNARSLGKALRID